MRTIMHVDLDAFFCSVEQRRNPTLVGKAFVVGGSANDRGVVATASYAARAYGIHAGTSTAKARQLCPDIIVVRPDYTAYTEAAQEVMEVLLSETSLVEQASIDEAYVDLADIEESADVFARRVQLRVATELRLSISCGIAGNKLVAKAATDTGKKLARAGKMPHAIYVVPPGGEATFLGPLPVDTLCGIGPKTTEKLHGLGVMTLGEIGWTRCSDIRAAFLARHAEELIRMARGIDETPMVYAYTAKSLSHMTTFMRNVDDPAVIESTLLTLSYDLARRLQRKNMRCKVVHCQIRWDIHSSIGRQSALSRATNQGPEIYERARFLLRCLWDQRREIRLVGVGVAQLGDYPQQLGFWDAPLQDIATVPVPADPAEGRAIKIIEDAEQYMGKALSTHRMANMVAKRWSPYQ